MVRNENQLLLVRFRGAHDRRTQCEKKLKQCEAELALLRGVRGAQSYQSQGHAQVHPAQQHHAPHAQGPPQQHQQGQQHGHGHPQHQQQQQHQPLPAMLRSSPPPPHPHHAAHPHFPQHHHHQHEHHEHDAHAYEEDGSYPDQQQHEQQEQQQEQYAHEQHDGGDSSTVELQPLSVEVADADVQPFELAYDSQRPYSPTAVRTQQQRHSPAGHRNANAQGGSRAAPGRWK